MPLTDRFIKVFGLIALVLGMFFVLCMGLSFVMPETSWPSIIGQRLGHAGVTCVITAQLAFVVLDNRKLRTQMKAQGDSK